MTTTTTADRVPESQTDRLFLELSDRVNLGLGPIFLEVAKVVGT